MNLGINIFGYACVAFVVIIVLYSIYRGYKDD